MSKRFLITIITLLVVLGFGGVAIFFAKGYRISPGEKIIVGTGIINITSEPDAASVFIDGHLTTATNATVSSLSPKKYNVRVAKEGFIPWEKNVEVKSGVVSEVKVILFPAIPTIYPLTFTGVLNPTLSPDGSKLAFVVPATNSRREANKKAGIWVWTMVRNQPIAFARSSEPHQIATNAFIDFSGATLEWSPDSKQVLASVNSNNYLLDSDNLNSEPRDITLILTSTQKNWDEDIAAKDHVRIANILDLKIKKVASDSANISWSPDETKFMVSQSSDKNLKAESPVKVYDLEDNQEYILPPAKKHIWLPNSTHVVMVEDALISIIDFDGTNKAVLFAGRFEDSFVFPWPDSSRLVFISSFPTPTASEPNLYGINLR